MDSSSSSLTNAADEACPNAAAAPESALPNEAERNFYFRDGDGSHSFEYGQLHVPEWRGKTAEAMLLNRVASGVKPIASLVVGFGAHKNSPQSMQLKQYKKEIHDAAHANDLVVHSGTNDWGVEVVYVCRAARVNTTLAELLNERNGEPHAAELSLTAEQKSRRVGEYAKSGFDCYFFATPRDPSTKVSVLESALLLGYPFDLAHGPRAMVPTSSVAAAGASAAATGYTGMLPAQAAPPANDPPRQDRMGMAPRSGMPGMPRMPAAGTARGTSTGPSRAASPKRRRASCGRQSRWGAPSTRARGRGR